MRRKHFRLPDGRQFEIPFEWWTEAGMDRFDRGFEASYPGRPNHNSSSSYGRHRSSLNEAAQPLSRPTRLRQDGHCALVNADRAEICPVTVTKTGSGNYRYRLHDGTTGFTPLSQSAYAYSGLCS